MMKCSTVLALALGLITAPAWGQSREQLANGSFRVTWQPQTVGMVPSIEGQVYNGSRLRVTNVRLQIEGLDRDSHPVGKRVAWALGDIAPGAETSFRVEPMSGAASYRIDVLSYDVVSGSQAP
jgi:hypothetical protein